jgi:hypothetical protein
MLLCCGSRTTSWGLIMRISGAERDAAYEAASNILNDIGLGACPFTLDQKDGMLSLRIERNTAAGKIATSVPVDHHQLKESLDDHEVRLRLRHDWLVKLAGTRDAFLRDAS